jgi:hypothetical protein
MSPALAHVQAIKWFAAFVEPLQIAPSPTLPERYMTLPLGGLDDMAVWAAQVWRRWATWLETAPPNPLPPDLHQQPLTPFRNATHAHLRRDKRLHAALGELLLRDGHIKAGVDAATGFRRITASAPALSSRLGRLVAAEVSAQHDHCQRTGGYTNDLPAALVESLTRMRPDLATWLAQSASGPCYASQAAMALTALADKRNGGDNTAAATAGRSGAGAASGLQVTDYVAGGAVFGYFGASLALGGDYDADGAADVVVGGWGYTWTANSSTQGVSTKMPQAGALYAKYGNASAPVALSTPAIVAPETYSRMGWSTCVLDFNGGAWAGGGGRGGGRGQRLPVRADGVDDLAVGAPAQSAWNWTAPPATMVFLYYGAV